MQPRQNQNFMKHGKMILLRFFSTNSVEKFQNVEMLSKRKRSERKPLVTGINELKRRQRLQKEVRQEVQEIILRPPANGLLVKRLIPVAHEVHTARARVSVCISSIIKRIPVHRCSSCGEVHLGLFPHKMRTCNVRDEHTWDIGGIEDVLPLVESFHLYDRVGRAVSHEERLQVDRIPAILELCIQAGLDIPEYPTRRRAFPVYNIAGKTIDFEKKFPQEYSSGKDIQTFGFWERREETSDHGSQALACDDDLQGLATQGMEAWEKMRSGTIKLMAKYPVQTCGYCPEVQVGPKGHRARLCQAFKHQMRDGQHAWQEATFNDLVPPVYVWHIPDPHSNSPLVDGLRKYYGKLPAAVELFAQAGANVGEAYAPLMREDVAVPEMDEEKWVV